jgi:MoaA/NifB/PqqE/SkfB family radical SAM enzyme
MSSLSGPLTEPTNKKYVAMRYNFNPWGATSIDWYIGKRCNFDCSYCVDYLHDKESPHVPYENMLKFVEFVTERHGRNVIWSLTGGEPTLNPKFMDLCKHIYAMRPKLVSITTNGSRTAQYLLELFQYLDNITLSLHFEFIEGRIEEYIKKIILLENYRKAYNAEQAKLPGFPNWEEGWQPKQFLVRFMVYPGKVDLVKDIERRLREAGVEKIEFRYIRPLVGKTNEQMPSKKLELNVNHDVAESPSALHVLGQKFKTRITSEILKLRRAKEPTKILSNADTQAVENIKKTENAWYSPNDKKELDKIFEGEKNKQLRLFFDGPDDIEYQDIHYNKLNFERRSNFEGWLCYAGIKHMKINPNGDIFVGSCHVGGKRGNIYEIDKGIDMPMKPIVCPKWRCTDNLDLRVPKIKSPEYYFLIQDLIEPGKPAHPSTIVEYQPSP